MATTRWGILSTADIGRRKVIPGLLKAQRVEVLGIASRDEAQARSVATELGIPRAYGSYEGLLADPDIDVVYIPLPNHLHLEWSMAAAKAGKHILCEKPLALTADDAQRMVNVAANEGVRLMEAFMYRLHPSWEAVRQMVHSGRIGQVRSVDSFFSYYNDDPNNIRNQLDAGGGALYDIGCYCINLSRLLFDGEPTVISGAVHRDPATGVDVLSSALLEFPTGTATFTCATRIEPDQRVQVYGTKGRISIEIPFNIPPDRPTRVFVTAGGDPPVAPATETLTFDTADPYTVEGERFASAILDGLPTPVPPEDAVANLRVIEAVFSAGTRTGGATAVVGGVS
jgi:predicted dehydrogenase